MCADELVPSPGLLAFGGWGHAVTLEDVSHGLVADGIAQVSHGSDDAIVSPGAVLLGEPYHQRLQFCLDGRAPWRLALRRAVELLCHQHTMPGEDGLRLDDGGYLGQGLPPELFPKFGQRLPLATTQPHAARDLLTQDPVFCDQI